MTTLSTNLGLTLFNSTTDATTQTFLQYRTTVAGVEVTSNFNKVDSSIGDMRISVKDFGAVGDGATDDIIAIQDAIDYTSSLGGGIVFIPEGIYKITSPIVIPNSIKVIGTGKASTTIKNFSTSTDAIQIGDASTTSTYVSIENLMVDSNSAMTNGAAINVIRGYQINIKNIFVNNHFYGIILNNGSFRYLDGITILHQTTPPVGSIGILISSGNDDFISNLYIDSTAFSSNTVAGIKIVSTSGLWISKSDIVHMNNGLLIAPGNSQTVEWVFFDSVAFDSSYSGGIVIEPTGTGIVRGCSFSMCWSGSSGLHSATPTWGTDSGVLISGSNVFGTSFIGHKSSFNAGHGFNINLAIDTKIFSSTISGNSQTSSGAYDGISIVANTNKFNIIGNRIGDADNFSDTQNSAIGINAGTSNNYIITGNNLQGNVSQIVDNGTGTSKIVGDNLGVYTGGSGTTASLALNATETIIVAGTNPAIYMISTLSETGTNTAWSGSWMVYVDGNITITKFSTGGGQSDCVASGTNIQIKNLNPASVSIKWSYIRVQ